MKNRLLAERPLPRDGEERAARSRPTLASTPAKGRGGRRGARSVTVNLTESPLGWLKARGLIDARQYEAGETLRRDWERAALSSKVTMDWNAPPPGRTARGAPERDTPTLAQIAARRRFDKAIAAAGIGFCDILWRVVCAGEGMREAEQALGWPARAGKLVLGFALDRLADHYRLR